MVQRKAEISLSGRSLQKVKLPGKSDRRDSGWAGPDAWLLSAARRDTIAENQWIGETLGAKIRRN